MPERESLYNFILEQVFANRNKRYGAYDLRRRYVGHLRIAFGSTLAIFALFVAIPYIGQWWETSDWFGPKEEEMVLIPVKQYKLMQPPPPPEKPKPATPPPKPPTPKPPASKLPAHNDAPPLVAVPTPTPPAPDTPANDTNIDSAAQNPTQPNSDTAGKSDTTGGKIAKVEDTTLSDIEPLDTLPMYPGGMGEFYKYILREVRYPAKVLRDSIEGTIVAMFIVNVDGSISNVKIPREMSMKNACDNEVIQALNRMPLWKPGRRNGENVRAMCTVKISFALD